MIRYLKQWLAIRRLNKLVQRNRNSYATRRYVERRAAAKLGIARRRGLA